MNVSEIIEELSKFDPRLPVMIGRTEDGPDEVTRIAKIWIADPAIHPNLNRACWLVSKKAGL